MHEITGRRVSAHSGKAAAAEAAPALGHLPEWNLADLYAGMDAPELKRDLARAMAEALAFEGRWKGTLAAEAARGAEGRLGEALKTAVPEPRVLKALACELALWWSRLRVLGSGLRFCRYVAMRPT